ncbi:MAG TPA: outer membrane beta-barrel protein [Gammaproteobacteria bacterium]|nr:outer membrane beta-barrel protein [Gammaproteobacteria bacterium]
MMLKRPILNVAISLAALGLTTGALAGQYDSSNSGYYSPAPIPVAVPSPYEYKDSGFIIGLQAGYADTHWDNIDNLVPNLDGDGFAARGYLGYAFNKYFAVESGYTYLPKATGDDGVSITNYAIDLLGKISWAVTPGLSIYAKAGGSYLHSNIDTNIKNAPNGSNGHIGPAYGVGASYEIIPNLAIGLDWERFSGNGKVGDSSYQPQQDAVFLGLSYKFPTNYS